jgi:ribosomal protein S18 acetylase RimI-like enzyme
MDLTVRVASSADAELVGRLLHDFNSEYDEPTPGPTRLAERMRRLLAIGDTVILLGGAGPDGVAVLRFRAAIWSDAPECYLAELYVVPQLRGQGLGRALMETAIEVARARGADHMDLGTSDDDVAARSLYESLGFINREGGPDGPITYFYERDI